MTEPLKVLDLSPVEPEAMDADTDAWLQRLQQFVQVDQHLVRLGEAGADRDPSPLLSRDTSGRWIAGRYIGDIAFEGRRLQIRPRLGQGVVERWLGQSHNAIIPPDTSGRRASESFVAWLLAVIWCSAVDRATRHGLPSLNEEARLEGTFIRGRLDVAATARLLGRGSSSVASRVTRRSVTNPISRALVAADRVLAANVGHDRWRTPRVKEVIPQLRGAVGSRPRLPSWLELQRVRYTPITRPFQQAAELSWRIARQEGFIASDIATSEGLLLDVAELWELFVVNSLREALPNYLVEHGTVSTTRDYLLTSISDSSKQMGHIKPDVLVKSDGQVMAVIDAKYKRLRNYWPERPYGVDSADLYQLASYLGRYDPGGSGYGLLVYPRDPADLGTATAQTAGPWQTGSGTRVEFRTLAVEPESAQEELSALVAVGETSARERVGTSPLVSAPST